MKRLLLVAVALTFATTAMAADKVMKTTETTMGNTTTTNVMEKVPGAKETVKINETSTATVGKDVTKWKHGDIAKETVLFDKYDVNGDYIYVMKDSKLIRVKHTLAQNDKDRMLKLVKGTPIDVTSTYPLSNADLAVITNFAPATDINKTNK